MNYPNRLQQQAPSRQDVQQANGCAIKGETCIEYRPYEQCVVDWVPHTKVEYIPVERKVVNYMKVRHEIEYVPQKRYEKVIEYQPVERMQEVVDYVPCEREYFEQDCCMQNPCQQFPNCQPQGQGFYDCQR